MGPDREGAGPHTELQIVLLVEAYWKDAPQGVIVPYTKASRLCSVFPSSTIDVEFGVNLRGPPRKAKYTYVTDSGLVP